MTDKITLNRHADLWTGSDCKPILQALSLIFDDISASTGKVEFEATPNDIPMANLWLRSADRVLLKMGQFKAVTFDELFEQTKALPWESWITKDGKFTVTGKSVKLRWGRQYSGPANRL